MGTGEAEGPARRWQQLIVVGASAGGIEALSALVANLPPDLPAPVVIAQHLAPHRVSSLAEILTRRGQLPVRTVADREELEPGVIFVVPPGRDVTIIDHIVSVHAEDGSGPRPSVDLLFHSAAQAYGEDLIAVVLSGSGSDGAIGAREVKQVGGTVIVQNPETAAFPGMPLSLAPSVIDIVANLDNIGSLLNDLLTGAFVVPKSTEDGQLRSFLDQLREESGIDFTTYKQPTIMRRLQRRMAATGQNSLPEYVRYVHRHTEERQRLVASFLINVTEFFRDPELFDNLKTHVLPELIAEAQKRNAELRLWSAGCATGEEAYSLAMLVAELLREEDIELGVRIFATDLDSAAVAFARQGIYPARALAGVPDELVQRYFTQRDGEYEVKKPLRSLLVFGEHDLGQRAPFPRIDLILCRNVLIYFTAVLQRRALQLFAFSLRPGGYLVLGKSESVSPLAEYFSVDQTRLKIFRRVGDRAPIPPGRIKEAFATAPPPPSRLRDHSLPMLPRATRFAREAGRLRQSGRAEDVLLNLPVGVVVVDAHYDIQSINAEARRIFGIHSSALDQDFIHLVQHFPTDTLRHAIDRVCTGESVSHLTVATRGDIPETQRTIDITCCPIAVAQGEDESLVTIAALDVTDREHLRRQVDAADAKSERLTASNNEVLSANQELTSTIAKLRSDNEELLVGAEEIQAATEEVETLNEELQASNEELETLNEELQATVEELNTTNDDLQARTVELQDLAITSDAARARLETVLSSLGEAVLVVDSQAQVMLSNTAYQRTFGAVDVDRRLTDSTGSPLPFDQTPQQRAARGEAFTMSFVLTGTDGSRRWYEAVGQPIPGGSDTQRGVVTIRDITERSLRHMQDEWLALAGHELRTPLTALQAAIQLATRSLPDGEGNNRTRRHLDQSLHHVRRIGALVEQMIDTARIQSTRIGVSRTDQLLAPIVEQTVETARTLAPDQEITLALPEEPLRVSVDGSRIEQVLLNVLTNAITYGSKGKEINVRVRKTDHQAEIEVEDRGSGISPDQLDSIFNRYQRLDRSARQPPRGLGLGLFIAREIMTEHEGTITAQSVVGEGSILTLRLPLISAIEASSAKPS